MKILFAGQPGEHSKALFAKLARVQESHGPWAACLTLGQPEDTVILEEGTAPCSPAVPLWVVTDSHSGAHLPLSGSGVSQVGELVVAHCTRAEPGAIQQVLDAVRGRTIDVLLTLDWPMGWDATLTAGRPRFAPAGVPAIGVLADALKPRYHVVPGAQFFARAPYRNGAASGKPSVTRFLSLAPVQPTMAAGKPGAKTAKWLHALDLKPAAALSDAELAAEPAGTTDSPFAAVAAASAPGAAGAGPAAGPAAGPQRVNTGLTPQQVARLQAEEAGQPGHFFWNQRVDGKSRAGHKRRRDATSRTVQKDCWFCMSTPSFERHLVVSIGDDTYLALPKGPLNETHCLLIPIDHVSALASAPAGTLAELEQYKACLARSYAAKGLCLVAFERVVTTRNPAHTHMQVAAVPLAAVGKASAILAREGAEAGLSFERLPPDATFADVAAQHPTQYLYFEIHVPDPEKPDAEPQVLRLLHTWPADVDAKPALQFGQRALAAMMQLPTREHWRAAKAAVDEEAALTNAFRTAFEPYDFTLEL